MTKHYSNDLLTLDDLLQSLKLHVNQADIILGILNQRGAQSNARELVRGYSNLFRLLQNFKPKYQFNLMTVSKVETIDVMRIKLITIHVNLDPPNNQHQGKIHLSREMDRNIANQLLIEVAKQE